MRITDGPSKLCGVFCFGFGLVSGLLGQNSRPAPPPPPLPPPIQLVPSLRPIPLRGGGLDTNRPVQAGLPNLPLPLVRFGPKDLPTPPVAAVSGDVATPGALVYDAEEKEYTAKAGETTAHFTFYLTNISSSEVLVHRVNTSCGCTVAKLPEQPWHLAPGASGPLNVTVDLRAKSGTIMKSVTVNSSAGVKSLLVKVSIPPQVILAGTSAPKMDRNVNIERAKADPQAIFKGDCAECHVKPGIGKLGKDLYAGACGVCHEAEHRATMVPDLHVFKHPSTREYWTHIIAEGKPNSLMPGFARQQGGVLSEQQVTSLVDYLTTDFLQETRASAAARSPTSVMPMPAAPPLRQSALTNAAGPSAPAAPIRLGLAPSN